MGSQLSLETFEDEDNIPLARTIHSNGDYPMYVNIPVLFLWSCAANNLNYKTIYLFLSIYCFWHHRDKLLSFVFSRTCLIHNNLVFLVFSSCYVTVNIFHEIILFISVIFLIVSLWLWPPPCDLEFFFFYLGISFFYDFPNSFLSFQDLSWPLRWKSLFEQRFGEDSDRAWI